MSTDQTPQGDVSPNPEKDSGEWVTGDEPMTKADASRLIDELQEQAGRGAGS
jgi:hypothetical protein